MEESQYHEAQAGIPELFRGRHLSSDGGLSTEVSHEGDALAKG